MKILFRRLGITFSIYGSENALERLIPFDLVPRIISASEWRHLERGIEQRVRALNPFLHDIYHRQEILDHARRNLDDLGSVANVAIKQLATLIGHWVEKRDSAVRKEPRDLTDEEPMDAVRDELAPLRRSQARARARVASPGSPKVCKIGFP